MSGEINTEMVGQVIDVAEQGLGLFSVFPLNIAVIAGILAIGIGLVARFIPRKTR